MASSPLAHSYILLKDKGRGYTRGSIVELSENGRYTHHSHYTGYRSIDSISAGSDEVAALTEEECRILDAVDGDADRYTVYSTPGKLAWGLGLKVGDTVLARLPPKGAPSDGGQQDSYTTAIIRWCGIAHGNIRNEYQFGAEITVSVQRVHCLQASPPLVEPDPPLPTL